MSATDACGDWTRGCAEGDRLPGAARRAAASGTSTARSAPAAGTPSRRPRQAAGDGTVHAVTLVTRAPTEELRAHAPYAIVLVDADEGFRLMAHGAQDLRIGDRVRCRFVDLAGRLVPRFERAPEPAMLRLSRPQVTAVATHLAHAS